MIAISLGLLLSGMLQNNVVMMVATLCLAAAGINGYLPVFWSLPTSFLTGSVAAVAIGLINSVGNLGGFVGPLIMGYLVTRTHSFNAGLSYLVGSLCLSGLLMLAIGGGRRRVVSA